MCPSSHRRLGAYEIRELLGRGAMGEVFRAYDPKLGRDVAIKVLPSVFEKDSDRLRRIEREARSLAQLNHANVAQIFGLEREGDTTFLVLELVPGESLADRLARGPLAVEEVIDIARQIAEGLEATHEAGVVHRDLKPANVRVTPDGIIKVLDFGLAKVSAPDPARDPESVSYVAFESRSPASVVPGDDPAADSAQLTEEGAVLGTPIYMSPEQIRGKPVDRRTDIWSFGCLIFECLTGRRAFHGESFPDVAAAIVGRDPDWSLLPADVPASLRHLLARCLSKNPRQRLRDVGEARFSLEALARGEDTDAPAAMPQATRLRRLAVLGAALAVAVSGGWFAGRAARPPADQAGAAPVKRRSLHVAIPTPELVGVRNIAISLLPTLLSFSPDGRTLAYLGDVGADDASAPRTEIFLRDIDSPVPRKVPHTEHAASVSFSPDGRRLAFAWINPSDPHREMRQVSLDGSPATSMLVDTERPKYRINSTAFDWYDNDSVMLLSFDGLRIHRVPVSGGPPEELLALDSEPSRDWADVTHVTAIRDGRVLLVSRDEVREEGVVSQLVACDLENGDRKVLRSFASTAFLTSTGHLLFLHGGSDDFEAGLLAQRFDPELLELSGPLFPIANAIRAFAVSPRGTIAYAPRPHNSGCRFVLLDRQGRRSMLTPATRRFGMNPIPAPDGKSLATLMFPENGDAQVFYFDLDGGTTRPVATSARYPAPSGWMPDGRLIVTHWTGWTSKCLIVVDPDFGSSLEPLIPGSLGLGYLSFPSFTPDGRRVVYERALQFGSTGSLFAADLQQPGAASRPLLPDSNTERQPRLSPDGKFIAYTTWSTGRAQVMVGRFRPEEPVGIVDRRPVSIEGGFHPFWSRNGSEIFYLDANGRHLVAASFDGTAGLEVGRPENLLTLERVGLLTAEHWDQSPISLMPDGKHFLVREYPSEVQPPHLVEVIFDAADGWAGPPGK